MRKPLFITLSLAFAALCLAASAPADLRTKLRETSANGVTKTLFVGRVQTDPARNGSAALTVYPDQVLTDSAGNVIASGFTDPFVVTLTAQQYAGISAIIKAAYDAQHPQ